MKKQEIDCADDIKKMKKDIGKKVAKRIDQVEKEKNKEIKQVEKDWSQEVDKYRNVDGERALNHPAVVEELEKRGENCNEIMEGQNKEQNEALLLGGIAGILFGAFYS